MTPMGGSHQEIPNHSSSENAHQSANKIPHKTFRKAKKKHQNQMDKKQSNATLNEKLNRPFNHQYKRVDKELDAMSPLECTEKKGPQSHHESNFLDVSFTHQVHHGGMVHPNFDSHQTPLDPDRSISDIPSPVPRYEAGLQQIMQSYSNRVIATETSSYPSESSTTNIVAPECRFQEASPWALIASPDLASHLELLQVAGLIDLTSEFFEPVILDKVSLKEEDGVASDTHDGSQSNNTRPSSAHKNSSYINNPTFNKNIGDLHSEAQYKNALLLPLTQMRLLDLSDIYRICLEYPQLNRYGLYEDKIIGKNSPSKERDGKQSTRHTSTDMPEMINDIFSPNWEVILYPERFDNGVDSLTTDILACSVAVHILKQCPTRKSVNRGVSLQQICQHMRSYVLSQCNIYPQYEQYYRQIRLFTGHIIFAAHYLNFKVSHSASHKNSHAEGCSDNKTEMMLVNDNGQKSHKDRSSQKINSMSDHTIYINVSSRSSLFIRYPDISRYYINGWS